MISQQNKFSFESTKTSLAVYIVWMVANCGLFIILKNIALYFVGVVVLTIAFVLIEIRYYKKDLK